MKTVNHMKPLLDPGLLHAADPVRHVISGG